MALRGTVTLPGDKSISHRALMLAALGGDVSRIRGLNTGADVASTRQVLERCGVIIEEIQEEILVHGGGVRPFQQPKMPLDCGNSGTTARLMLGMLAGQPLHAQLTGDASLSKRPMERVIRPLQQMGANISAREGGYLPVMISGRELWNLAHELPVASAQVKSALLLAGLWARGETVVQSPAVSRDHTERMLEDMGARIRSRERVVHVAPLTEPLDPLDMTIPGDLSAAAFLLAAATLIPDSELRLPHTGINPTRTAILEVLEQMGAHIQLEEQTHSGGEPTADLLVRSAEIQGTRVSAELIPNLIDEIPLLMVLATQAEGETELHGAEELRVKESDRLSAMTLNLREWGVEVEEFQDGFCIAGPQKMRGGSVKTCGDHRIAMAMTVAGLLADQTAKLDNEVCIDISFPGFLTRLMELEH